MELDVNKVISILGMQAASDAIEKVKLTAQVQQLTEQKKLLTEQNTLLNEELKLAKGASDGTNR